MLFYIPHFFKRSYSGLASCMTIAFCILVYTNILTTPSVNQYLISHKITLENKLKSTNLPNAAKSNTVRTTISTFLNSSTNVFSTAIKLIATETLATSSPTIETEKLNSNISTLTTTSQPINFKMNTELATMKETVNGLPPNVACYASKTSFNINLSYTELDLLEGNFDFQNSLQPGGIWELPYAKINVTIIIPYRKRERHLSIFVVNMHKFLQLQNISYALVVVNQVDDKKFNRGGLFNVGFHEAQKMSISNDCYFFHDVDLIPENGYLTYCCSSDAVLHYATAIWKHSSPGKVEDYSQYFGGVVAATTSQFQKANGFSNNYWGWGGEDDDFKKRVRASGQKHSNIPFAEGRYVMFKHDRDKGNEENGLRFNILGESEKMWMTDGLKTLNYTLKTMLKKKYYTEIQVSF